MDNLFKQTRLRFSNTDQDKKDEPGSSKDRRIPPQKTPSFKDKKKEPNWFRKQVTWQMSQDYGSGNAEERAIAVAAAAYAITSLEEPGVSDQEKIVPIKKEDPTISIPDQGRVSRKFSGEITQTSEEQITAATDAKKPKKALLPAPSFKKTPSSLDKQLGGSSKQLSGSFGSGSGTSKPDLPTSSVKPAQTVSSGNKQPSDSFKRGSSMSKPDVPQLGDKRQNSTRTGIGKSQANIWEETELARITERYETQKSIILSWEGKRKTKAKRRLDKTERELERKKAKALAKHRRDIHNIDQVVGGARAKAEEKKKKTERELERKRAKALAKYRRDIHNIDQVVGGARAKAEEKKKNDELKVKEKANIIRKTGKVPNTCSCF